MNFLDRSPLAQSPAIRPLLVPCALIGLYAVVVTFGKDLDNYWPLNFAVASWRFGAMGFFLGTGAIPVLGLALIALVGSLGEYRGVSRAAGVAGILLGSAVVLGLVMFLVDSQTVMATARGDAAAMVRGAVRRTATLGFLTGPAYLALGVGALRAADSLGPKPVDAKSGLVSAEAP